ncbi:HNH endonuclease [Nocardiopsis algeriensis]|uniref:5-methylcytosine-specific restriction protein A n=1 Tax=Nocardiopsis algeriensis TaxID=1478215 RepID=A0A841ISI4_9ACTN|nr:HNH endonuclease [Nocardiopsis algeriensis]MBB6121637.1 5-methylcytosine-specific restriction protein A [Nocardiopsis algeriensis]
MPLTDITRDAVLQAIAEYDDLGQDDFLDTYGFKRAVSYDLVHNGRTYDSKAICGVAHKYVTGQALPASKFSGGAATVGKKLSALGFEVRSNLSIPWAWDELILACDLLARHDWTPLDTSRPEVVELSRILKLLPLHPQEKRPANFRSPSSVRLKMANIHNWHKDNKNRKTNGSALDRDIHQAFVEDPERMHAAARSIREGVISGELTELPPFEEEADEEISAPEGRLLIRKHYARERSRTLRTQKIKQTRAQGRPIACEACSFDFAEAYGDRGDGYIEVHHIVPLHHVGESTTRLEDLALLCANCHRMVHVSKPWLTVDQLSALVAKQRPKKD